MIYKNTKEQKLFHYLQFESEFPLPKGNEQHTIYQFKKHIMKFTWLGFFSIQTQDLWNQNA